ncbi:PREDICTED: juvenile hormone acid O-methyltransferase-like isoform X2 [Branchiostoma belcheri]|uniref:Juvenile hormone acid O-methyltransferase-like isoform X2 n=1 Tax=Branchiostoma belcheri TaxID=7741 RepID=A0A6P4YZV8_BRABE|nr:PREDICTED: juvenile hormone acid O-methyltransferase-like isoform X2 [Branchiostoma belcheri]
MDTTKPEHYSQNRSLQQNIGVELLQQYMRWEGGDTVLDAGCGTGEICKYISQQPGVASVVGFDVSPDFISFASQHNSSANMRYHVSDVSDASTIKPEWQGAFSKVVSFAVLHWIQDKVAALKVLHSCLKPGGEMLLWFSTDKSKFCQTVIDMATHHKWKTYLNDFEPNWFPWPSSDFVNGGCSSRLLEECGFEVLSTHSKEFQESFSSKKQWRELMSSVLPHLSYIPLDKHEDFLDDVEKMAKDIHYLTSSDYKVTDKCQFVHARKM